jgi:hypothetical protein
VTRRWSTLAALGAAVFLVGLAGSIAIAAPLAGAEGPPLTGSDAAGPKALDTPSAAESATAPPSGVASGAAPPPSASASAREPDFTPPPGPSFTQAPQAASPASPEQGRDRVAVHEKDSRDAHADRVVLLPTAFVHPAGTVYVSDYDILLLQAGYAVAEGSQLTLTGSPPIGGSIVPLDLSLKSIVARDGAVQVAAIGSISGVVGLDQGYSVLGRVGAVAQLCFDEKCRSSASLGADVGLAGTATLAMTGAGVIWRVASWLSLLLEVDTLLPLTRDSGRYNGVAMLPGLRLPHRAWSLDFALGRASGTDVVLPLVVFTVRFLP